MSITEEQVSEGIKTWLRKTSLVQELLLERKSVEHAIMLERRKTLISTIQALPDFNSQTLTIETITNAICIAFPAKEWWQYGTQQAADVLSRRI